VTNGYITGEKSEKKDEGHSGGCCKGKGGQWGQISDGEESTSDLKKVRGGTWKTRNSVVWCSEGHFDLPETQGEQGHVEE